MINLFSSQFLRVIKLVLPFNIYFSPTLLVSVSEFHLVLDQICVCMSVRHPVGCKWARVLMYYCEWGSLSGAGLRPRCPPGILIRGLAAYSLRSRACQSHTHSITHPHLSFGFFSQTPSLSQTCTREFLNLSHLCRGGLFDSRLWIRFCVKGCFGLFPLFLFWLAYALESLLYYSEVIESRIQCKVRDFSHDIIYSRSILFSPFLFCSFFNICYFTKCCVFTFSFTSLSCISYGQSF